MKGTDPEPDLGLDVPNSLTDDGREAKLIVTARLAKLRSIPRLDLQSLADELVDSHREPEVILEYRLQSGGGAKLICQQPAVPQENQVLDLPQDHLLVLAVSARLPDGDPKPVTQWGSTQSHKAVKRACEQVGLGTAEPTSLIGYEETVFLPGPIEKGNK